MVWGVIILLMELFVILTQTNATDQMRQRECYGIGTIRVRHLHSESVLGSL